MSSDKSERAREVYREYLVSQFEEAIAFLHEEETSVLAHEFDQSENSVEGIQTREFSVELQTPLGDETPEKMHPKVASHERTATPRNVEPDSSDME